MFWKEHLGRDSPLNLLALRTEIAVFHTVSANEKNGEGESDVEAKQSSLSSYQDWTFFSWTSNELMSVR